MPKIFPNLLVEAKELRRTYRQGKTEVIALASATLQIWEDDRIALVGRSGSGKSTLLHLLGGLDIPTSGTIRWTGLGRRETLRPAQIAFVFQTPSLLAPLTVIENVAMPLLLGKTPASVARTVAMEALERIGLESIAHKLPEELSGGQAQRVALARALAYHPKLILADEPTGQLDHITAQHLLDVLLNTLEDTDTALVIATHDPAVADRMGQQWTIQHGILQTTANLHRLPAKSHLSIVNAPPSNSTPA